MIDPVMEWFEVMQHDSKCAITISNLIETKYISKQTCPTEITNNKGSEFIGHEFKNYLISKEYDIKIK